MIVKDEEETLARCLRSIQPLCDEIIIVDTGSTDRTVEIAQEFGAKIFHHESELIEGKWIPDFSAARNQSFDAVTAEWILWVDADDTIDEGDHPRFLELKESLRQADFDVVQLDYFYLHNPDGSSASTVKRLPRILRRACRFRWMEPVHECLGLPPMNRRKLIENLPIHHHRTDKAFAADDGRNLAIMKHHVEAGTASDRLRFYYGKDLYEVGKHDEAEPLLIEYADKWAKVDPGYAMEAAWRLTEVYKKREDLDKAAETAHKALSIDCRWPQPYMALSHVAGARGDHEASEHWARIGYDLPPPPNEIFSHAHQHKHLRRSLFILALDKNGKHEEARAVNRELLRALPGHKNYVHNERWFANLAGERVHPGGPVRLNLGCGNKREDGWWNCDLNKAPAVDQVFSLDAIPFDSGSVDAIRSEHALEHLPGREARQAIVEWARVLKPGGTAFLQVPDLEACMKGYLETEDPKRREWFHHTIFGYQEGLWGEPAEAEVHRTGFSKEELEDLFYLSGFVVQYARPYDGHGTPSLELLAVKERSQVRVLWICPDNRAAVQSRLRCLVIHDAARKLGYQSEVVPSWQHLDRKRLSVVVASNGMIGGSGPVVKQLRQAGAVVLADLCEDLLSLQPSIIDDLKEYNLVACSSHELAKKVEAAGAKAVVMEDSAESPEHLSCMYDPPASHKLKVGWVGYGGGKGLAEALRPVIEELGMELVTIHEHEGASFTWAEESWAQRLAECDIAICPADPQRTAKGQVKAVQAMALGLPVVAGSLDSYERLITNGVTGVLTSDVEGWRRALIRLKDPVERQRIGRAGRLRAESFRPGATAIRWWDLIESLSSEIPVNSPTGEPVKVVTPDPTTETAPVETPMNTPLEAKDIVEHGWSASLKIDSQVNDLASPTPPVPSAAPTDGVGTVAVIVTTYNCMAYTKLCIESLRACRGTVPYKIHVIDAGSDDGTQGWVRSQLDLILHGGDRRRTFSEVVNLGIAETGGRFFCILNNDLVVSPGWLDEMVRVATTRNRCAAVGVLSNCDVGWIYHKGDPNKNIGPVDGNIVDDMTVGGQALRPKMRIGDVDVPQVIEHGRWSNEHYKGQVRERTWVAFYCTLIARCVTDEIGVLDEGFKTGGEDLDFCNRLQRADYNVAIALGSFVFHWGAVSRQDDQVRRGEDYDEEDRYNNWRIGEKWRKPNAVIYTGPAWERWSPDNIDKGGLGGSETCEALLGRELVRKGWRVTHYGDCADREGVYDGVEYLDHTKFPDAVRMNYWDFFIGSRWQGLQALKQPVHAGVKIIHVHDIWLHQQKDLDLLAHKVDAYGVLSPWHFGFFQDHHPHVEKDKLWIIPDGVDTSRFTSWEGKNPHSAHWLSSWDRGLWNLLKMWPRIRAEVPDAVLNVYYGTYNWEEAIKVRNNEAEKQHFAAIKELMNQPGVIDRGRLGQADLAKAISKDALALRPQWFDETFGVSAVESMAAGAIVVYAPGGALKDTVGEHGVFIDGTPGYFPNLDENFASRFVSASIDIMKHPGQYDALRHRARAHAAQYDWSHVTDLWITRWRELVSRRSQFIGASKVPLPTF